jgi:hypothetical protein
MEFPLDAVSLDDRAFLFGIQDLATMEVSTNYWRLNEDGCHKNCKGCWEPGRIEKCLTCKDGFSKVDGACLADCSEYQVRNTLGKCQECPARKYLSLNYVDCKTCIF